MSTIYSDLNVRLENVEPSDIMTITDAKAVLQSLTRLLFTEEGEIPYYRSYGLALKKFIQKPMTEATVNAVYAEVENKVKRFEPRAEIISATCDANMDLGQIYLVFSARVKTTNEVLQLPMLTANVSTAMV